MARLLIVEDHEAIREGLAAFLKKDGHDVQTRGRGDDWATWPGCFDLFLLDVMLPGLDGFQLARNLRRQTTAPILFLTARTAEEDRLEGWELGADDYIVKPFSAKEVVYRVRSLLKRAVSNVESDQITFVVGSEKLLLDRSARRVSLNNVELVLTPAEREILLAMTHELDKACSRQELMEAALGYFVDTGARTIDTHVKNLRTKLGHGAWIETVRAHGYRFCGVRT